jgi:hypothetical protein
MLKAKYDVRNFEGAAPPIGASMNGKEYLQLQAILAEIAEGPLGGPPPLPECAQKIHQEQAGAMGGDSVVSEEALRWLELLNRGIDPHLLRQALKDRESDPEILRKLIRYLVTKKPHFQADREKVDWLVTHLFEMWEGSDRDPGGRFEVELEQILEGHDFPPLSPQAEDLLQEIPALLDEMRFYEQFSQIADSRIISQGRYLKGRFGEEFFHPKVLAAIVNYNLVLGRKMHALLQDTMETASRSDGAGTTGLPATEQALQSDYRAISDVMMQLSKLDKEVQHNKEQKRTKDLESQARAREASAPRPAEAKPRQADEVLIGMGIDPGRQAEILRNRMKEIANRVKASPGGALPSTTGSLVLSDWEAKAFATEYPASEESFRADFARSIASGIGIITRIEEELPAYFETQGADHLKKRHSDALLYLLHEGRRQLELLKKLSADSERRGLEEKSKQLTATAEKLEDYVKRVTTLF